MATAQKSLVELAEEILEGAKALEKHLPSSPTFQNDTIGSLPSEHQHVRMALIDATGEMNALYVLHVPCSMSSTSDGLGRLEEAALARAHSRDGKHPHQIDEKTALLTCQKIERG